MGVIILLAISSIYTDFCTGSPENILFKPFVNMIFLGLAALVRFLRLATISGFSILVIFLIFSICESNFSLNSLCFFLLPPKMLYINFIIHIFTRPPFWLKFLIIPDNFSLLVIFLVKNIKNPKV